MNLTNSSSPEDIDTQTFFTQAALNVDPEFAVRLYLQSFNDRINSASITDVPKYIPILLNGVVVKQ